MPNEDLTQRVAELERKVLDITRRVHQEDVVPDAIKMRHIGEGTRFLRDGVTADLPEEGEIPLQGAACFFDHEDREFYIWSRTANDWVKLAIISASPNTYTQTYSTADRTHAAPTAATLMVADGAGTNDNTIGAITADASVIAAVQELADEINKLVADVADTKQIANAVIDDLQAVGLIT